LPPGATVRHLLETFRLVPGEVGLVVVNGALADEARELPDGARVELYPVFGGG
ncbi:MAG: MoaD/ThiS family protein, partial [Firmicutes bacterium]|nr:MoaD/ThiS family protein [Bacillota bacterium]